MCRTGCRTPTHRVLGPNFENSAGGCGARRPLTPLASDRAPQKKRRLATDGSQDRFIGDFDAGLQKVSATSRENRVQIVLIRGPGLTLCALGRGIGRIWEDPITAPTAAARSTCQSNYLGPKFGTGDSLFRQRATCLKHQSEAVREFWTPLQLLPRAFFCAKCS